MLLLHSLHLLCCLAPQLDSWDCRRISAPMPTVVDGTISDVVYSTDGTRLVYRAREVSTAELDLFSIGADGTALIGSVPHPIGTPVKLNDPRIDGGHPASFVTAGTTVVYRVERESHFDADFYGVPIDGSAAPVRLTPPFVAGDRVLSSTLSPDGAWFLFVAGSSFGRTELFSVPATGGPLVVLSPASAERVGQELHLDPTAPRVVYRIIVGLRSQIHVAPLDAANASVPLSGVDDILSGFPISPDGARVVYSVDHPTTMTRQLFSVPIEGGVPVLLTNAQTYFDISPDSRFVVFQTGGDRNAQLFSVPIGGAAPPTLLNGDVSNYSRFELSPDSARVVFRSSSRGDLYSAPIDGRSPPLRIDDATLREIRPPVITRDGRRVLFVAGAEGQQTLCSTPIDGSAPPALLAAPVLAFALSPDGLRVVYTRPGYATPEGEGRLFSTLVSGSSAPTLLDGEEPLPSDSDSTDDFHVSPAKGRVAWLNERSELITRGIDARAPAYQLGPSFPENALDGDVFGFVAAPEHAAYAADQNADGTIGLYSVRWRSGDAPLFLDTFGPYDVFTDFDLAIGDGGRRLVYRLSVPDGPLFSVALDGSDPAPLPLSSVPITSFRLSSDGSRAFFLAGSPVRLLGVPVDGSAPAAEFSGAPVNEGGYQIAPDGRRVVYGADQDTRGIGELYTSDGVVHRRIATMPAQGDVQNLFALSPDGTRAFYTADARFDGIYELFSVPSDGSAPPVVLTDGLAAGQSITQLQVTPDGASVVFRVRLVDNYHRLFSTHVDGSSKPIPIDVIGHLDDEAELAIDASGTRVVYLATVRAFRFDLFSGWVDGREAPVRLNEDLAGSVQSFQISPDGTRVVYLADQDQADIVELYSCPIDGSSPPVMLNESLTNTLEEVDSFAISTDGTRVAYLVKHFSRAGGDLFLVPIDGSQEPIAPACDPLLTQRGFAWTSDSSTVLYRAMVQLHATELFAGEVERAALSLRAPDRMR